MHRSLLIRQVAPAVVGYLGLIAAAILLDVALHKAGLVWVGRYLGPVGTALVVLSFLYSLRKRKKIAFGAPKRLLELHETLSWSGALLILVHAGIHINAIVPWLAVLAMLVVVASGFTGSVLVKRATETIRTRKPEGAAGDSNVLLDAVTLDLMKQWRMVHLPINAVFLALFAVHLVGVVIFWHW
jgi:hypothetical protein